MCEYGEQIFACGCPVVSVFPPLLAFLAALAIPLFGEQGLSSDDAHIFVPIVDHSTIVCGVSPQCLRLCCCSAKSLDCPRQVIFAFDFQLSFLLLPSQPQD